MPNDSNGLSVANVRIDMGAYGGTAEASLAPLGWALLADLNNDRRVDWLDLACLAADWASSGQDKPGDLSRDGRVGEPDLALFADQWRHKTNAATGTSPTP